MTGVPRYNSLNEHLKRRFSKKILKLSLSSGMGCPNLDGTLSETGCVFCAAGSSAFSPDPALDIPRQLELEKARAAKKSPGVPRRGYIAYFGSYTNTYGPAERLEEIFTQAISDPEVEILSVATRPGCLEEDKLRLLERLAKIKPVWVELGLQTADDAAARLINRGYPTAVWEDACERLRAAGIETVTHLILGLPGEGEEQIVRSARLAGERSDGVKLQLLHVLRGTPLEKSGYAALSLGEYLRLLAAAVESLPPKTVIHRLTGDGDKRLLVAPLWSADKKRVLGAIQRYFEDHDVIQGKRYE